MRIVLHAGIWLMGLLLPVGMWAQTVPTTTNGGSGYTTCPVITVAAPPAVSATIPILDQRRGATSYSAEVRVDDFGCAADGVTDDTQCFNDAIQYATQGGTRTGSDHTQSGKDVFDWNDYRVHADGLG